MHKKIFGTVFILAIVLVLTGASCTKKESTAPITTGEKNVTGCIPATGQTDTAKEGDIGKMNDDLYVEIQAQMSYRVSRDDLYADWASGGYLKFLASQGVTEKQFVAYSEKIINDPNSYRPLEIMEKIEKRVEELQK